MIGTAMYKQKSILIAYYTIYGGLLSSLWFVLTIIHGSRKEVRIGDWDTVGRITEKDTAHFFLWTSLAIQRDVHSGSSQMLAKTIKPGQEKNIKVRQKTKQNKPTTTTTTKLRGKNNNNGEKKQKEKFVPSHNPHASFTIWPLSYFC